jgi:hypothetical protein
MHKKLILTQLKAFNIYIIKNNNYFSRNYRLIGPITHLKIVSLCTKHIP